VNESRDFRTSEEEVLKLLEECAELKRTLKTISLQIGRMEARVKHAFPTAAARVQEQRSASKRSADPSITPEQALAEFDRVVGLVASGANEDAERILETMPAPDLSLMAREVGVSFPKSKPSVRVMREAIFGKVRESILLTRHNPRK
jgi:hypothetical protein